MKNNPNKTPLFRSPRMLIFALIGALFLTACAATQKPSVKASPPTPDLSKQIDYEAMVKGTCITVRELHHNLLRTDPDKLDKMGKDFWQTLTNCVSLDEAEEQIEEGK